MRLYISSRGHFKQLCAMDFLKLCFVGNNMTMKSYISDCEEWEREKFKTNCSFLHILLAVEGRRWCHQRSFYQKKNYPLISWLAKLEWSVKVVTRWGCFNLEFIDYDRARVIWDNFQSGQVWLCLIGLLLKIVQTFVSHCANFCAHINHRALL